MISLNEIIEILEAETFNTSDEAGNDYRVIESDDFKMIAEKIIKLNRSNCKHVWDEGHNNVSRCIYCGTYSA